MESSQTLYYAALVGHIVGITLMAGATFIDSAAFRFFWKTYRTDPEKSALLARYLNGLQRFMGIGMLFILVSGVTMMIKMHGVWGAQLWFRIKMGLLILVILNGLVFRRQLGAKLNRALSGQNPGGKSIIDMVSLKKRLLAVQTIQILLFITIFILSIFKFN